MSTTPITTTELINASTDAEDFAEIVNSLQAIDVTTRLGAIIPTLIKAIRNIGFSGSDAWLTATTYSDFKILITEAGDTYILVEPHTSGVFATDLSAGKWELYHPGGLLSAAFADILGTVSESGGVPTGDIIESFTSGQWEVIKFASGMMVMESRQVSGGFVNVAAGNIFETPSAVVTFPESFIGNPSVFANEFSGVGKCWGGLGTASWTVSGGSFILSRATAVGATPTASLLAIGRWF